MSACTWNSLSGGVPRTWYYLPDSEGCQH